jgi:serine/threonine protein phosphatase PrpC
LGHELIVAVDRITMPLQQDDQLIVCTDGLYSVVEPDDLESMSRGVDAVLACRKLIDLANQRGTADNLTVAVFSLKASIHQPDSARGWRGRIAGMLRRHR